MIIAHQHQLTITRIQWTYLPNRFFTSTHHLNLLGETIASIKQLAFHLSNLLILVHYHNTLILRVLQGSLRAHHCWEGIATHKEELKLENHRILHRIRITIKLMIVSKKSSSNSIIVVKRLRIIPREYPSISSSSNSKRRNHNSNSG